MGNIINWFKNKITFLNGSLPAINDVSLNDLQKNIEQDISDFVQGELINNIPITNENSEATNLGEAIDELINKDASKLPYNNIESELEATTVQEAIDELAGASVSLEVAMEKYTASASTTGVTKHTVTISATKEGFFPIALGGDNISNTSIDIKNVWLTNVVKGSCTINIKYEGGSSQAQTGTITVYVGWIKV